MRTPLLMLVIALPFAGCTCEWQTTTYPGTYSTYPTSGGEQVVVVQEPPEQRQQERDARIAREREWERERERERYRHSAGGGANDRVGAGPGEHVGPGRMSTGAGGPHAPAGHQHGSPDYPSQGGGYGGGSYGGVSNGGSSAGSYGPAQPAAPSAPAQAPSTPSDTYVPPREIDRPTGGPAKAANAESPSENKSNPARPRVGRMTRQQ